MRTRTKNTIHESSTHAATNSNWVLTRCDSSTASGTYAVPAQGLVIISETSESMTDSLGRSHMNPCDHKKVFYTYSNPGVDVLGSDGLYVHSGLSDSFWIAQYRGGTFGISSGLRDWDYVTGHPPGWWLDMSSINETTLKNEVVEKSKQLKADVLLNLVEANQVWPAIRSLTMSLPAMAYHWKRLRKVIRTASGSYLAWKFGVSPILSDMMSIHRYLPQMGRDMKRHEDGEKSRFSTIAVPTMTYTPIDGLVGTIGPAGADYKRSQGYATKPPVIRYVLVIKPKVQYGLQLFKSLDAFASRFATSPASLAWELVPFSFVVDWFVDLRGVLGAIDRTLGFSPYEVYSFSRSLSYSTKTDYFHKQLHSCNGSVITDGKCLETEFNRYIRTGASAELMPSWSPRFGKNQAGISAALIAQKLSQLR